MSSVKEEFKRQLAEHQGVHLEAPRPKLKLPKVSTRETDIYETTQLASGIDTFSVVNPGNQSTDSILKAHNPSLLAMSKRAKVARSVLKTAKPTFKFPSVMQGATSLLTKKPLSDLPDPTKSLAELEGKREEQERMALDFKEDPIAYFSKRKDGRGHLFIYMKYVNDPGDPDFNPYELVKVTTLKLAESLCNVP